MLLIDENINKSAFINKRAGELVAFEFWIDLGSGNVGFREKGNV